MVLSLSSPLSLSFAGPASGVAPRVEMKAATTPTVSYTHLTLPTIYSV